MVKHYVHYEYGCLCRMEDSVGSGALVEGIGDEVLITLVLGGVSCILALAWYSTHLTSSQARLTAPTIHRSGVRLNRLQGSSTAEARANNQVLMDESLFVH